MSESGKRVAIIDDDGDPLPGFNYTPEPHTRGSREPKHIAFDLIYNPKETQFLKKAKKKGAVTKNGYEMLVLQAEKAWKIWNK